MYPIEVYKISKECVMCESLHSLQVTYFDVDTYVTDRVGSVPKEARIKNEFWKIKLFTEGGSLGYGKYTRWDKYVAVDPVLEKLLTAELEQKHKLELTTQYNNLSAVIDDVTKLCDEYSDRFIAFYKLPWYKRIYRAIRSDI